MSQEIIYNILEEAKKERLEGLTIDQIRDRMIQEFKEEVSRVSINNSLVSMLKFEEVTRKEVKVIKGKQFIWMLSD
jgi:hypothetical protein